MTGFSAGEWDSNGGAMDGAASTAESLPRIPPQWYAIRVRPRFEKKAESQLHKKGIETFLPLLRQVRWWSDRRKMVEVPLFSGYEFVHVHLSPNERLRVLQTAGVMNFVGFTAGATPVKDEQLESLRRLLATTNNCCMHPFLRSGQKVRIRGGSLNGVEGILQENVRDHLVLSIDCIQRSISVHIDGYDLEAI
jgi:transcription termination/antitermination protein NusG